MLVEHNILYPCWARIRGHHRTLYLPQLPIYAAALKAAAHHGYDTLSDIPRGLLERYTGSMEAHLYCRSISRGKLRV